jgi:hypothetical protein
MRARRWFAAALVPVAALLSACVDPVPIDDNEQESDAAAYFKDCYEAAKLDVAPPAPARELFILVDQTTGLDDGLRGTIAKNIERLLGPGTMFKIATFSARNNGRYATLLDEGEFQKTVPDDERPDVSVRKLENLDQCLVQQEEGAKAEALHHVGQATGVSASTFTHSEILASLTQLSEAVKASPAKDKLVIVVSDLLEYSPAASFYQNRDLRTIDPTAELERATRAELVGDFDGARIAVVGAGLLSAETDAEAIRNTAALAALRSFWKQWLDRSNAQLVEYGEPDLVTALHWSAASAATAPAS